MMLYPSPTVPRYAPSSVRNVPYIGTLTTLSSGFLAYNCLLTTCQSRSASFTASCHLTVLGVRCPSLCHALSRSPVQNIASLPFLLIISCDIVSSDTL